MEATGNYHLCLADYLYHAGIEIVIENPLKIKRFSQMNLNRTKTDKADAQLIYEYATMVLSNGTPHLWQPDKTEVGHLKQYDSVCQQLIKQRAALSNSEEALTQLTGLNDEVTRVLKDMLNALEGAIKQLEQGMLKLVKSHHHDAFDLVTSIPGIGPKTATMMICLTDGFNKFTPEHVKQFISYIGMSPRTVESGTSVQGRAHISKIGNGRLRSLLYMCSWTAKRSNQQCATLYERLHEKGKPEKVIKVALSHKLIRQIFGVIKSGVPFSNEFA
ncbi:MAG: IS110 family transposase [Gammaproteobacteria bacterium]|nr:IS110 family transposase [Gammaproteobacteria bacterium]